MRTRWLLVPCLCLAVGCRPEEVAPQTEAAETVASPSNVRGEDSPPAEGAGSLPAAEPALDRFDERVRRHLRDRRAWHDRVLARPDLTAVQRAEVHGELALLYHAYDLRDAARELYEEAARLQPDEARWPHYLGHVHRSDNHLELSVDAFRRALALDADLVPARIRLAEVLIDLDRTDEAVELLQAVLARDPDVAVAHAHLGKIYADRGQPELAAEHLSRALELQPEASALRTPLGLAYRDLGRDEEARREIAAAGDVDVTMSDPLMLRLHELDTVFWSELGAAIAALNEKDAAAAQEKLSHAIAIDGLAPEPRFLLGQLMREAGHVEEGMTQIERSIFLSERAAPAHLLLAQQARRAGDLRRAIDELRRAVEDDPETAGFRIQLGDVLLEAGLDDEAAAQLRRAQDMVGNGNPMPLLLEATAYVASDRCGLAIRRVEEGLAASPQQGFWLHALARLLAACPRAEDRQGERALELARTLFETAPSPGHAEALALAMAETGDIAGAAQWQRRAIERTEAAGEPYVANLLRRNLAVLESGAPVREPWRRDSLILFRVDSRARTADAVD